MANTNITNFRKNLFEFTEQVLKFNEPLNVTTKDGNIIVLSEEEYRSLIETVYLHSVPGLTESIVKSMTTPEGEFEEFDWRKELASSENPKIKACDRT